jgi:hypothetical protein
MTSDVDEPSATGDDDDARLRGSERPPGSDDPLAALEQQRYLRRILAGFAIVVVLLPIVGLGGTVGATALLPAVLVSLLATRDAVRLRRSVRRHGHARGR